jgi:CxxC-x17-CxxC domain-containing protein
MGNFQGGGNRGGGFRGGNGGGGRPNFGGNRGGDRGPVSMHKAVCDECHKSCEVPFRPSGDKPVYCSDCFGSKREDSGDRAPRREFSDRAPRREFNDRPAPSFSKPVSTSAGDDTKKQLAEISVKLDRLASVIERLTQSKVEAKPVVKATQVVAPKVEVKKIATVKPMAKKVEAKASPKKATAKKVVSKKTK